MENTNENASPATKPQTPLPPGMVMGPDGKPCKSCTAHRNFTKIMKKRSDASSSSSSASSTTTAAASSIGAALSTSSLNDDDSSAAVLPSHCPPDVELLGRSTWTFLHTTAAYYPESPNARQRSDMLCLLRALPTLYPCSHCASHLQENLRQFPPDKFVGGRGPLSRWLCERHNDVNKRLGKVEFDCNKTDERWKDGPSDGSCD
ncbi:hypothetical protein FRB95_004403 [Tulasnella sp. JGI-2019a]|nr:hypothetical protein FRB95_004403 [Tulasnella sp. JGI-2019a]